MQLSFYRYLLSLFDIDKRTESGELRNFYLNIVPTFASLIKAFETRWEIMSDVFRERLADRFSETDTSELATSPNSPSSPSFSRIENFGFKSSSCHLTAQAIFTANFIRHRLILLLEIPLEFDYHLTKKGRQYFFYDHLGNLYNDNIVMSNIIVPLLEQITTVRVDGYDSLLRQFRTHTDIPFISRERGPKAADRLGKAADFICQNLTSRD